MFTSSAGVGAIFGAAATELAFSWGRPASTLPYARAPARRRPAPMDAKQAKLQGHRLRLTRMTLVSSSLQAVLVALFAWSGTVTWPVATAFGLASIGSTGFFTIA